MPAGAERRVAAAVSRIRRARAAAHRRGVAGHGGGLGGWPLEPAGRGDQGPRPTGGHRRRGRCRAQAGGGPCRRRGSGALERLCEARAGPLRSARREPLMPPAARITDMHVCPMVTPGLPPIPHVGGPILPPGAPTVLIGGLPAAVMGGPCVCVGPPDTIILGSMTVLIGGQPAARMGDMTAHGGTIVLGCPTVMIGG